MFDLGLGGQDHRHRLWMDRTHFGIGFRREESKQLMLANDGFALVPRVPCHGVQTPAKAASGRLSSSANQVGVLRGFVSAYSQNEPAGRYSVANAHDRVTVMIPQARLTAL
jgi:hypothetical protein